MALRHAGFGRRDGDGRWRRVNAFQPMPGDSLNAKKITLRSLADRLDFVLRARFLNAWGSATVKPLPRKSFSHTGAMSPLPFLQSLRGVLLFQVLCRF